ncbi:hypothetical protein R5R35_004605 [Gryllus longicercus]
MTTPAVPDELPEKLKESFSENTMPDGNLTLSILDELGSSHLSDSSIDLQLRFQRLLAESALENSAFEISRNPAETTRNEFTLGTSTPRFSQSNASLFGESNKQKTEEFEALFKKYYSEDFVPAENAAERLLADEKAWKQEFGFIPPGHQEKLELSCFSGIIGDAEISLKSVVGTQKTQKNKVTPEEYFNLKTDKMGSLDTILSSKERPNFGQDIESPNVNRARIAFVNPTTQEMPEKLVSNLEVSTSEVPGECSVQENEASCEFNVTPNEKSCSTLSVTGIEEILSKHLQDTPGTIARSILNPKNKTKSTFTQDISSLAPSEQLSDFLDNHAEKTLSEQSDRIQVEMSQTEYDAYVGCETSAVFQIQSKSSRWLKCKLSVHKIVYNNAIDTAVEKELSSNMQLPDVTLVGPGQKTTRTIIMTPTLPGNFEIYVNVSAEDAVTQLCKNCIVKFQMFSKMPKVEVREKGVPVNIVDFGTLAESCRQLISLEIMNYSDVNLPLTLNLEEVSSTQHTFTLCESDNDNSVNKCLKVDVAFKAPLIENRTSTQGGFVYYSAYLNIATTISSSAKTCLLKKLKLKGCVGITQLLFNFKSPVEISSPGPGVSKSVALSMKNGGVVPLDLKLTVIDSDTWQAQASNVITVSNSTPSILPGKETRLSLTFTPSWVFEEQIKRKLMIHVTPGGNLFEVEIHAHIKNDERSQIKERLSCHSSGSSQSVGSVSASSSRSITGMPVQTTHKYLVWNTVPVGKIEMQSCRLRNDWASTVKIRLSLVDGSHGFWLLNENGEHVLERKMRLHAKECVPVNVIFSPTKVGVAYGKILVHEAKQTGCSERFAIPLFGYCGTFNMSIRNISKDKSGNMWINLGPLDSNLHTQFTVFNKGNLDSFIYVNYVPKGVGALLQGVSVSIEPSKAVIAAGSNEIIKISFALQNDVSFIVKDGRDMLELGNLYITCGDEPTRQRIRRIRERQPGNPTLNRILNLENICSPFSGETCISELSVLNDPENALRSLCRTFQQHEIALTVECMDDRSMAMQTCIGSGHLGNQSLIFKSMLPDATFSASVQETSGKEVSSWTITPSTLTLLVPRFASGCITIASTNEDDQMFEIGSSEEFLSIEPSSGIIPGMGEVVVVVTCNVTSIPKTNIKCCLKVYLENDMKLVIVHIKPPPEKMSQQNQLIESDSEVSQKDSSSEKIAKNKANRQKSVQLPHSATYMKT